MSEAEINKLPYRYYKGYKIKNHSYYQPDKGVRWEAFNEDTGCVDFRAKRLKDIINMINQSELKNR